MFRISLVLLLFIMSSCAGTAVMMGGANDCGGNDKSKRKTGENVKVTRQKDELKTCNLISRFRCGWMSNEKGISYDALKSEGERKGGELLYLDSVRIEKSMFENAKFKYIGIYEGEVYSCSQ